MTNIRIQTEKFNVEWDITYLSEPGYNNGIIAITWINSGKQVTVDELKEDDLKDAKSAIEASMLITKILDTNT